MANIEHITVEPQAARCTCHDTDLHQDPVLDARLIPHAVRHAAIFGALDSLAAGQGLVIIAPHDPKPLLAQARARYSEGISVDYLQEGPDAWHVRLGR